MLRYRWLHRPTDELPGLLVALIGGACIGLLVERTETSWRLTDGTGRQETRSVLPEADDHEPMIAGAIGSDEPDFAA